MTAAYTTKGMTAADLMSRIGKIVRRSEEQ